MVQDAQMKGYQVLEPLSILITHLDVVVRRNLHELIQRQHVKDLINSLENDNGVLLEEIKKKEIDLSLVQNVIKQLLKKVFLSVIYQPLSKVLLTEKKFIKIMLTV